MLVEANGALVTKDRLIEEIWPEMIVEENTLQAHISAIRKVLGEDARWIATVPGQGYRFAGPKPGERAGADAEAPATGRAPLPPRRRPGRLAMLAGGITIILLAALDFWHPWRSQPSPSQSVKIERYLVLPFLNRTGDPHRDDFADALSDAVAGRIAALAWDSQVVSHNQAFAYKGRAINEAKLAEDLRLTYIVEGSLLPNDGGVDASITIVDAHSGIQIATVSTSTAKADPEAERQSLVTGLVDQALSSVFRHEKHLTDVGKSDDSDIRNLLIRAETSWGDPTLENWAESRALIDKALKLDPHNVHALALAGASRIEYVTAFAYSDEAERAAALNQADTDLTEAARTDPKRTIVHLKLGDLHAAQGRHDAARAEFQRALDLDPSNAYALERLALEDIYADEPEAALSKLDRARQPNPDDLYRIDGDAALVQFDQGHDEAALTAFRHAITIKSNDPWAWIYLTGLLQITGRPDEAREALKTLRQLNPKITTAKLRLSDMNAGEKYRQSQERLYAALEQAGLDKGTN